MSKIMKVVYIEESSEFSWDGSNSHNYLGEEEWKVGEHFNGEFIQGTISSIVLDDSGWVYVFVLPTGSKLRIDAGAPYVGKMALALSPNSVQRIYYGEE